MDKVTKGKLKMHSFFFLLLLLLFLGLSFLSNTLFKIENCDGQRQDYVWRQSSDTGIPPMEKAYMEQNDIVTNKEFHKYARYVQHK